MNSQIETKALKHTEHVDLSSTIKDSTLSLYQQQKHTFQNHYLCAQIQVFDLSQVHATPDALSAIKRAFLTEPYLIELYALHYVGTLFRAATRGNDKGLLILDPSASTYEHRLRDGSKLVVQGETIDFDGSYTRRLTISYRKEHLQGGVQ